MQRAQPTRYAGLGYWKQDAGLWRFVDTTDGFAVIGGCYRTKAELLADLARFADERGFTQ